ncbi:anthranilate synthase component II [Thiomonas intermedia]|uniref:anthranilate synthase component II n=1 Tax=Thiomonas intermedia TaxID=926 RepID=UPI0009A4F1E5|nr:aminodeoxychorismate/anthranilate synthase component II [Thiomonas intermedia]
MLCLIDNYDSFTYNIVHYLHELDVKVKVILNDEMSASDVLDLHPRHILLSPGPGTPDDSGMSKELLRLAAERRIPLLGVCLGHEIIGEVFGGRVRHAKRVMHGKVSRVHHDGRDLFVGIPEEFAAARYHSLIVERESLPNCLNVTAWTQTDDGTMDEIMGVAHASLPIYGVQFHPESILTEYGHYMLANFLGIRLHARDRVGRFAVENA